MPNVVNAEHEKKVIQNTLNYFIPIWENNIKSNMDKLTSYYAQGIGEMMKFSNFQRKIAVCGAGPSLDEAIPYLKANRDKMKILAVDAALHPLYCAQIHPDWVINIDAESATMDFFKGYPTQKYKLIVPITVHPSVLEAFKGDILFCFPLADDEWSCNLPKKYPEMLYRFLPVTMALNVGNTAFLLALKAGFREVLMIGMDLSFTGGKYYANNVLRPETAFKTNKDIINAGISELIAVNDPTRKNPDGTPLIVLTTNVLAVYARKLAFMLELTGKKNIVNLSCPFLNNFPMQKMSDYFGRG